MSYGIYVVHIVPLEIKGTKLSLYKVDVCGRYVILLDSATDLVSNYTFDFLWY